MVRNLFSLIFVIISLTITVYSQNVYSDKKFQFLSYEKIPTWTGVVTNWHKFISEIHLYDFNTYLGHAQYVSVYLKTGITFKQFKDEVKDSFGRRYLPFFLYDLRDSGIVLNNIKYTWAVRIEDYRYTDNTQEMTKTVVKLMHTLTTYIKEQSGDSSKGIIILATNPKVLPNTSIAGLLQKNGIQSLTLAQLLAKTGSKKVEILNSGTGIGYLKYVAAGQESSFKYSAKDILIFENLPARVPPVYGIITLEPQTPLSHINLLARNRKTINLYATDLKYIPGAESLLNKLVKISCSEKKISITEVTEKEAIEFWNSRIYMATIPLPLDSLKEIIDLNVNNPTIQTIPHVGAKAFNYSTIRQLFPKYVRPGYAIPFYWYFNTIKSCGADTLINKLIAQKPGIEERNKQLAQIRERILNAHVNPDLLRAVTHLIDSSFFGSSIRLRSSTNCEDLSEFNGAGLYTSEGYKQMSGDSILALKILRVYASLWNTMAFEEREYYFIDHSKTAMAILINESFSNEYANGVAVTIPNLNLLSIMMNTQYGENSVTNPVNGQIPESLIFAPADNNLYEIQSRSNIHDIFLQEELKSQLDELHKLILDIHAALAAKANKPKHQHYGVDIEYKILFENGKHNLYIKQARMLKAILPE